ncbi:hypothetical protein BU15DRAFT_64917 [Melanogaster broomeanus]|nr:hypothetical protein BU15DRAFT_64917 [Melanogaster broomeanus]
MRMQPNNSTPYHPYMVQSCPDVPDDLWRSPTPQTPIPTLQPPPSSSPSSFMSAPAAQAPKLQLIFETIRDVAKWSFAEFLYYAFRTKDGDGNEVSRTAQHAAIISRFLSGRDHHLPAGIIDLWLKHPDGRPKTRSGLTAEPLYSPTPPYSQIKAARASITSFAVQIVEKQLQKEQRVVLQPSNGLAIGKSSLDLTWEKISSTTTESIMNVLMTHQPLYWHYTLTLATPARRIRNGVVVERKYRPPKIVSLQ